MRSPAGQQNAVRACLANGRGEAAVYLAERGARLTLTTAAGGGKPLVRSHSGKGKKGRRINSGISIGRRFRFTI